MTSSQTSAKIMALESIQSVESPSDLGFQGGPYDFHHLNRRTSRDALLEMVNSLQCPSFTFLTTTANPKAVDEFSKYVKTRNGFTGPWETKLRVDGEESEFHFGSTSDEPNGLWFSNGLVDHYVSAITALAGRTFGENQYVTFSPVITHGVHNLEIPSGFIYLPRVHVVDSRNKGTFVDLVGKLNEDVAYMQMQGLQGKTKYQMAEIDKLRELRIPPLVIGAERWEVNLGNLKSALEFLVPFSVTQEHHLPGDFG